MNWPPGRGSAPSALIKVPIKKRNGDKRVSSASRPPRLTPHPHPWKPGAFHPPPPPLGLCCNIAVGFAWKPKAAKATHVGRLESLLTCCRATSHPQTSVAQNHRQPVSLVSECCWARRGESSAPLPLVFSSCAQLVPLWGCPEGPAHLIL